MNAKAFIQEEGEKVMVNTSQTVQVTLQLPRSMYQRVTQAARTEQRQVGDFLNDLVAEGLETHMTTRELLEHASQDYRDRLAREGKLNQPSDAVQQDLRILREQVAHDLYPG